jgi:hypothetical protein
MKIFHNKLIGKLLALILGLACAVYFGWTFSFFGYWMGTHFQGAFPEAPTTIALACGAVMFLAVVYTFFFFEYVKEDVLAYEDDKGDGTFYKALKQLKWGVLGLEIFSLIFRYFQLAYAPGTLPENLGLGLAMIGIGLVLLWLAHLFGKTLHAQVNVPHDVEASRVMNEAGRKVWTLTRSHLSRIKDVEKLRRVAAGDLKPIDEVKDVQERERLGSETRAAQRRKEEQERRDKARQAASRHLAPRYDDPVDFIESPNGNKRPANF